MSPESEAVPAAGSARRRTRRVDATRNREALLAAARQLFDQHGPDVAFDRIAKAANVANATLYRHFATRAELVVAAYEAELDGLHELADSVILDDDPDAALTAWLHAFVRHVATKRSLALAVPDEPSGDREAMFAGWHRSMHDDASRLLARAKDAGRVRPGLSTADLLALAVGIALTGLPQERLDALLDLARDGYRTSPSGSPDAET